MSNAGFSQDYLDRFGGVGRLYGEQGLKRLSDAHICVFGVGGVGSWTVESLARSGVGRLTIVDLDDVCVTNTNRQIHTLTDTVGHFKVDVMANRVFAINPSIELHHHAQFFTSKTAEDLLTPERRGLPPFDAVVDAIDHTERKALLIARCWEKGLPIIVSGAAGGRCDPTQVTSSDLSETTHDGLLRNIRRALRSEHLLPKKGKWGIPAVFSVERPVYPSPDGGVCDKPPAGEALTLNCQWGFGAVTHLTATFGFTAAHLAIQHILKPR